MNCSYTSRNPVLFPEQIGTSKIEMEERNSYCQHTRLGNKKPQNILPHKTLKINLRKLLIQNLTMLKSKVSSEKL